MVKQGEVMQKKALGVAVAVAFAAPAVAFAQSSVQIYGTANLSFNYSKYSASESAVTFGARTVAAGAPAVSKYAVNSHGSNWGFRSTETLGGGMTAWLQQEYNMKLERENGVFDNENTSRNSGVGLRGGFGNIYVGTWETPWAQTFRLWDVGTIGGYGPTTSVMGRRENTGSGKSANCANLVGAAGGVLTTSAAGGTAVGSSTATTCSWVGNTVTNP